MDPNSQVPQVEPAPQTPVTPSVMETAAPAPESPPQPVSVEVTPPQEENFNEKKNSPILIVAIILAIVAVLAVVAYAVAGRLIYTQPIATVAPVVTTPTPTPDPTANWKMYSGNSYSFKYPVDWKIVTDNNNGLKLQPLTAPDVYAPVISVSTMENLQNKSFTQLHEQSKTSEIYSGNYDPTKAVVKIDAEVATYLQDVNCEPYLCDIYTVLHNRKIYFINNLFAAVDDEKTQQRNILSQILSTFQFVTATPSATPTSSPSAATNLLY